MTVTIAAAYMRASEPRAVIVSRRPFPPHCDELTRLGVPEEGAARSIEARLVVRSSYHANANFDQRAGGVAEPDSPETRPSARRSSRRENRRRKRRVDAPQKATPK